MTEPKKPGTPWSTKVFTIVAGLALGFVIAIPLVYRMNFGSGISTDSAQWNNFGTFVGGVLGPVLSVLAFFALVYTIFLQEQQLSLARATLKAADEDKKLTQKQLTSALVTQATTANALELQNKIAFEQVQTATFFEMVRLHNQMVAANQMTPEITGSKVMTALYQASLKTVFNTANINSIIQSERDGKAMDQFLSSQNYHLGSYFQHVAQIFKFVDGSVLNDKQSLVDIFTSQLSQEELALLYYYGVSTVGRIVKPLLEKYAAFKNLSWKILFDSNSTGDYDESAWGESWIAAQKHRELTNRPI